MPNIRLDFKVLLYPEDGWWIAHCLEMDLPAEGKSPSDAVKNLVDLVNFQVKTALEEGDLESVFSQAPAELWRLFSFSADKPFEEKLQDPVQRLDVRKLEPA